METHVDEAKFCNCVLNETSNSTEYDVSPDLASNFTEEECKAVRLNIKLIFLKF